MRQISCKSSSVENEHEEAEAQSQLVDQVRYGNKVAEFQLNSLTVRLNLRLES